MANELRNCMSHGPFRGPECPECGNYGKLLMRESEIEGVGRIIAGMLRHFPENYGVKLDEHGWVMIYNIVPVIKAQRKNFYWLTPFHIEALAMTDPKQRYQVNREHEIRASYGHTIPVNMDDLPTEGVPDKLYYQTTEEELEFIRETGISPSDKSWIHLSLTARQAYVSGMFHIDSPTVVEIDIEGLRESGRPTYRATDEVFLVNEIPPEFIREKVTEQFELTPEEDREIKWVRGRTERKLNRENARDQP